jgi:hypothetical protein
MSTTSAYGWNIPDNTDLVKDGALAIRTLGNAIDTSMNTALGTKKAGMVLLNTTSFSGVSSQSVNDVFSSTYENYRIVFAVDSSAASVDLQIRLRVSGSDNSSTNYAWDRTQANNGTGQTLSSGTSLTTFWVFGAISGTYSGLVSGDFFRPFATDNTGFNSLYYYYDATTNHSSGSIAGITSVTTSYTGFTFFPSGAGTISGTVSVYGYNK